MHPIFVDLGAALREAEDEARLLERARQRFAEAAVRSKDPVERWTYAGAMAAGVEKVYSGLERVPTTVAGKSTVTSRRVGIGTRSCCAG